MEFTRRDLKLSNWLSRQDPQQISIKLEPNEINLKFTDKRLAQSYWENRFLIKEELELEVTIWIQHRFFDSTSWLRRKKIPPPSMLKTTQDSSWVKANSTLYRSLQDNCTVAVHSESPGYPYLSVQPFLGLEAVLCKPSHELIGKPASIATSIIGETRTRCIERAIAVGGTATDYYDFDDENDGFTWSKKLIATYLPSHQEVIVRTENLLPWQSEVWRKRLEFFNKRLTQ